MPRHRKIVAVCVLLVSSAMVTASTGPDGHPARLIGTWELVGIGESDGNVTRPDGLMISFSGFGECRMQVREHGHAEPFETDCRFTLTNGVLKMTAETHGYQESFHVAWDGSTLVLEPIDSAAPNAFKLRFEKRAWTR